MSQSTIVIYYHTTWAFELHDQDITFCDNNGNYTTVASAEYKYWHLFNELRSVLYKPVSEHDEHLSNIMFM